jgi:arylsulfatase
MPTVVELSDATNPEEFGGARILPMKGVSLLPAFQGENDGSGSGLALRFDRGNHPIFWEFAGNHAVRDGNWKLVAERSGDWELYDLSRDRCEMENLRGKHPKKVARLARIYDAWAARTGAKSHEQCRSMKPSTQSQLFDLEELGL